MQCSRLMKKVWGNKVDEKRERAQWNGIGWKRRPRQRQLGWLGKPLQCVLIPKFGDTGLNYEQ